MPISERALHGSYLDVISTGEFKNLEPKLQRQALAFARDFMRCTCKESPFCGCIERKISKTILEMRMEGLQPAQIISSFSEDYGIYAYQGDLINFLDQAVRILEAVEAMAKQQKKLDMASEAARSRIAIEGE
jgi:helicase